MKSIVYWSINVCILFMALAGISQSAEDPTIINIMVDMDVPPSPNSDELSSAMTDLFNIAGASAYKNAASETSSLNWTLFLVNEASLGNRLLLAQLGLDPSVEFGISGNQSYEKLSEKSYDEQKTILKEAKEIVTACKVCGINEIAVKGFMPQSFDQNEDTLKILDELNIEYDAGYQAGILYAPGHENDVWPYLLENHNTYAVPVSTYSLSGEIVPLSDKYAKDEGLSASQWYDLLAGKFNGISGKDEPMVIYLSTSISGSGEYLDAYKRFVEYALSQDGRFVKTCDLVEMARTGEHIAPALVISASASEETPVQETASVEENETVCKTCDSTPHQNTTFSNGTIVV